MSNDFLSQEEIDSLLTGGNESEEEQIDEKNKNEEALSSDEKDLLGEVGNISMGSASTALSQILNQPVNITTPKVTITTLKDLKDTFEVPNIALEVKYTSGIVGENLLVMKIPDAAVVSSLMMGGDGKVEGDVTEISEIEQSAVSEAMNQMIGSAATSMATMFGREVNISPPISKIWDDLTSPLAEGIEEDEDIIKVAFDLQIGGLVDSQIMQVLPIKTAKKIVGIMMGTDTDEEPVQENIIESSNSKVTNETINSYETKESPKQNISNTTYDFDEKPIENISKPQVEVKKAQLQPLEDGNTKTVPKNIDLILDVPLNISVVLGRTKMNIKNILELGVGSLIELDKLAEEPVEVLVNGKIVAYGEVVVVDENFGVRLTNIVSNEEKIKSLGR